MTAKQKAKHLTDGAAEILTVNATSSLDAAEPTPDELGAWEGGCLALRGAPNWVSLKSHPQRTGDTKNAPGIDYPSKCQADVLYEEPAQTPSKEGAGDLTPTA